MLAWMDLKARFTCLAAAVLLLAGAKLSVAGQPQVVRGSPDPAPHVDMRRPETRAQQVPAGFGSRPATPMASHRPLARLVRNPGRAGGLPPFALTDQAGTIQRYVEPVPGIDLEAYLDQVIVVRHDTGRTLLASQLDLPPRPLYPMVGEAGHVAAPVTTGRSLGRNAHAGYPVQQAQFAEDDLSVELLDEGPGGFWPPHPGAMSDRTIYPQGGYPAVPGGMADMAPVGAGPYYDPAYHGPAALEYHPAEHGAMPCPNCGGYCHPEFECCPPFAQQVGRVNHFYADVEFNFLRAHVTDEPFGKLSETYEFSPRFIVGFHDLANLNGRFRYWHYDRATRSLGGRSIRLQFDVFDLEATHHFAGQRAEVLLAAGIRVARLKLADLDDREARSVMPGLTLAADGRTPLTPFEGGRLAWVYGGRLSILGGDWRGDDANAFTGGRKHDDNIVVQELYTGVEYTKSFRDFDLHARAAFEMQNWHSDVLANNAGIDSIGFLGPGLRVGVEF